ncbi:MAG: STAS domain-containing protein [Ancalomicrobiaceae bacterium]|nr:STAS domain-containing protein [Ancalomicrobiaceae bacterium]
MGEFATPETVVTLPAFLDLSSVAILKASLADQIDAPGTTTIDCSKVERITTPAIQVLLAYSKSVGMRDRAVRLSHPTETFRAAFDDLGLHEDLMRWSAPS